MDLHFLMPYLTRIGYAAITLVVGIWLARGIRKWVAALMKRRQVDEMVVSFAASITHALVLVVFIIAALGQLGVETTSLLAILGAAGLAIGLALQNSLSNFAAGIMIILFRPFRVGDWVEAGGVAGVVEGIQIFYTQLRSADNKLIIVPNSNVTNGTITNFTARDTRRVDLVFGISYRDDIDKAKRLLGEILAADARVLKDPAPVIAVSALAESSVNLIVRPWVKTADYWDVYWALTEAVKVRFDAAGITIPFPQREMHVRQTSPGSSP